MSRPRVAAAGICLLAACGAEQSGEAFSPDPDRAQRVAWIGVRADGAQLVVEPLAPAHHPELAVVREEDVLRQTFGLEEDAMLLRAHERGGARLEAGRVRTPEGHRLEPLGEPPEDLAPDARLIWYAAALGGAGVWDGASETEPRSYLLVGHGIGREDKPAQLEWQQGGETVILERMDWNERERRTFLDAVEESHPSDEEQVDE